MIKHIERTCTVLAGILLVLFVMAGPVQADDAPPVSTIDASRTGSLHISKDEGDPLTQFGDPSNPLGDVSREPISGLVFEIRKVETIDLTTNEGWTAAAELSMVDFVPGGAREGELGETISATTDADGVAHFNNLPLGLYYVTENQTSAQSRNLSVLTPFFVTVPTTNEARTGWEYDVVVHAKDQKLQTNKSVEEKCLRPGDTFSYAVTGTTPAPNADNVINRFEIADPLDASTAYNEGSLKAFITDYSKVLPTTELAAEDFEVAYVDNVLSVKLTTSGLEKLSQARYGNPGVSVSITFDVTATTDIIGTVIKNRAYTLTEGYPDFDEESKPGVPSNETRIKVEECEPATTTTPSAPTTTPDKPTPGTPPDPPRDIPVPPNSNDYPVPEKVMVPEPPQKPVPPAAPGGSLASTGASVIGVALGGAALVFLGLLLTRRRGEKS